MDLADAPARAFPGRPRPWESCPRRSRPWRSARWASLAVSEWISESGSSLSRRTPLTSLRKTSFSAPSAWATAVAAVSALTFSFSPLSVEAHRRNHRHDARRSTGCRSSCGRPGSPCRRSPGRSAGRPRPASSSRSPNSTFVVRKFSGVARPPNSSIRAARCSLISSASTRSTMSRAWRRRCSGGLG